MLIDSCEVISRKMRSVGEVCWKRQFNTKIGPSIPQGFIESLFHVDGVFPNVSFFFFFLTFFKLIISMIIQFSTIFHDTVTQSFSEVKSVPLKLKERTSDCIHSALDTKDHCLTREKS